MLCHLTHNCGSWVGVTDVQIRRLQAPLLRALRLALGLHVNGRPTCSDAEVLSQAKWQSMRACLTQRRLAHLRRILLHAPAATIGLVFAAHGWKHQVLDDLRWLQALTEEFRARPDPETDVQFWIARALAPSWHQDLRVFSSCFSTCDVRPTPQVAAEQTCYECGQVFGSMQKLRTHQSRVHGIHNPFYWWIGDLSQCPSCLVEFHLASRLIQHLAFSTKPCGALVREHLPVLDMCKPCARAVVSKRWNATLPATKAQGPLPKWATSFRF